MGKWFVTSLFGVCLSFIATAQEERKPDGGGGDYLLQMTVHDELAPAQRKLIVEKLQANEKNLRRTGRLPATRRTTAITLQWPLRQAPGFYDNGYYAIVNYVDHNPEHPDALLDYNCGKRTYDLPSGYNHKGTDIVTWPFPWRKMQTDAVQVVAAAPGVIIGKFDGNPDQSCALCTSACFWNAVYIMHEDGSVAWYGHLKNSSLTTKAVGDAVGEGEYLGIVGSSGSSVRPHLHLEIYTNNTYTELVDPWAGSCNSLNGNTSWWADQQPYFVPTLNKIMTHSKAPKLGNCPSDEEVYEKTAFADGDTVYLGSYYRDQRINQQSIHTVYRPNGTVFLTWGQTTSADYITSWWYYRIILPAAAMPGMWRYSIAYADKPPQSVYFSVNAEGYVFIGNGNWSNSQNWLNTKVPPAILPSNEHIVINPVEGGECVVDQVQQISSGGQLILEPGKRLTLKNDLLFR